MVVQNRANCALPSGDVGGSPHMWRRSTLIAKNTAASLPVKKRCKAGQALTCQMHLLRSQGGAAAQSCASARGEATPAVTLVLLLDTSVTYPTIVTQRDMM